MNFKHLHYFWVTAKTGGIVRAGKQLHITPQTLSGQIKLLEDHLGKRLLRKNGRHVELTEAGQLALLGLAQRNTVSSYQRRYPSMPRPVINLGQGRCKLWLRAEIETWRDRRADPNPRTKHR